MPLQVNAVYENGVLRPLYPLGEIQAPELAPPIKEAWRRWPGFRWPRKGSLKVGTQFHDGVEVNQLEGLGDVAISSGNAQFSADVHAAFLMTGPVPAN